MSKNHKTTASYQDVIRYLYEMLPAYQRIGNKAFKKDLTNITALCKSLGNPHLKFPAIHIAGTNGKGSVANMIASIFQEAGYRTGLYTSPHISDFRERIQVNGQLIHKNSVIQFVKRMQPIIKKIRPSFFELTVAMAFDHFYRKRVDIAIVETGLGGRLDSTNILLPRLSIITNIGLEHQSILGSSLAEIASEKAGIIKPEIPLLVGKTQRETSTVFKQVAREMRATILFADKEYELGQSIFTNGFRKLKARKQPNSKWQSYQLDLTAEYQVDNAITVLAAMDLVNEAKEFSITPTAIVRGLKKTTSNNVFKGRWQSIQESPRVIVDGSHNADGMIRVVRQLQEEKYTRLSIIYGCVSDKDLSAIIPLLPPKAEYYLTKPNVERGQTVDILEKEFSKRNLKIKFKSEDPRECLRQALLESGKSDLILVTGSIFLLSSFL